MYKDVAIRISPRRAASQSELRLEAARVAKIKPSEINDLRVVRKSIDARKRPVLLNLNVRLALQEDKKVAALLNAPEFQPVSSDARTLLIVGAGPGGLFAALEAIRQGIKPIIVERGKDVDARRIDLANISRDKKINPASNYCFGEGGAGAYSDGKLFTRSKKRGSIEEVLQLLVAHGASEDILIEAHPHIGSDRLPHVIKAIRNTIIKNGGEVHFETQFTDLISEDRKVKGIVTDKGEFYGDGVVLATGHSAHDTFRALHERGVAMSAKGIAVGVRLEHPQNLIDSIQYHDPQGRGKYLPPAEYSFVTQADGRGVYSFCMCPGGVVVPAGSGEGELVVNGMSASARAGRWANSGMVVEIHPGDFPEFSSSCALEMLDLQESLEKNMFEAAGESIIAPAQRMTDFVEGKVSETLPQSSYAPGIQPADFNDILPPFISSRLKKGFMEFGRKAKGFLSEEAILLGLESRTSSPLRMDRDSESMQSISIRGLFPVGEGAGYAGGIVSAAMDGIRAVRAFADSADSADSASHPDCRPDKSY